MAKLARYKGLHNEDGQYHCQQHVLLPDELNAFNIHFEQKVRERTSSILIALDAPVPTITTAMSDLPS